MVEMPRVLKLEVLEEAHHIVHKTLQSEPVPILKQLQCPDLNTSPIYGPSSTVVYL